MKSFTRLASLAIAALPLAALPAIANPAPHFYPSPTAEAWQYAGRAEDGSEFYLDTGTVQKGTRGETFFWYQLNFKRPVGASVGARVFAVAQCPSGRMQNRQLTFFNTVGRATSTPDNTPSETYPETSVSRLACELSRPGN